MKKTNNKYPKIKIYNGEGLLGDSFVETIEYLGTNEWCFIRDGGVDDSNSKLIHEEKYETHQLYNELYNLDGEDETDKRIKEFKSYISNQLKSRLDIIYPLIKELYPGFILRVGLNKDEVSFILSELDNDTDIIDADLKAVITILEKKRDKIRKEKMKGKRYPFGRPSLKTKYDSILSQLHKMELFGNKLFIK